VRTNVCLLTNGPGLLRLSVDNATWLGISGLFCDAILLP
jgi:hypothetical protein